MRQWAVCAVLLLAVGCGGSTVKKTPIGGACTPQSDGKSDECADGMCLNLDATSTSGVCTKDCSQNPTCPQGYSCTPAGRFGMACLKARGCKTTDDCPAGHVCDTDTSTCYIKVSRTLCDPCEDDAQCPQGGACFTALGSSERFCTAACGANGDCPDGYICENLPGSGKTNQCVPKSGSCNFGKPLCAPCRGDNECGTAVDLCVRNVVSGEQFCGRQCSPDRTSDCPANFTCTDLKLDKSGSGPFQCVPNSNTCQDYCDTSDEHQQVIECGLGRTCDTDAKQCVPANDGRMCAPCETNDDCAKPGHPNNQCIVNNSPNSAHQGETFCAEPCDTDYTCLQNLGPGFTCSQIGNEHFCTPNRGTCLSGLGTLGDDCSENGTNDCITAVCIAAGVNGLQSICSATCQSDTECGDPRYRCCDLNLQTGKYDCTARNATNTGPASGQGVCAPPGGNFGDDCSPGRPPCVTGACLDLGTAEICSSFCDNQPCPPDFECKAAIDPSTGDGRQVCFPSGGGVTGGDCTFGPAACASGLCIRKDSGNICTQPCTATADCPAGWACEKTVPVGQTDAVQVCVSPELQ